jgi:hypothetical protein
VHLNRVADPLNARVASVSDFSVRFWAIVEMISRAAQLGE